MRITFITTVFNEEKTITPFLESLFSQGKLPDEIIIVDSNSIDKTIEKISEFPINKFTKKLKIKLIIKKGNRSVGRNTAIRTATGDIIVCSDAGCFLDKDFIKNIVEPFKKKTVDVVSGFYKPVANNVFEKCLATYTSVMPDKVDKNNFLPSSRSVAFTKSIWKKGRGYPEELDTCEDLVFDEKLKHIHAKFYFAENAFVYWPQRKNLWEAVKQFFSYAKGDGQALYFRKQTPLLFIRYLLGFSLLSLGLQFNKPPLLALLGIGFILYLFWAIWKNYRYIKKPEAFFWLPVLQITSDIAVLTGTTIGLMKLSYRKLFVIVRENKIITALILFYIAVAFSQLHFGIPSNNHPFSYNMDEWAEAFSLRTTFKYGTPHIHGGGEGTVLFYVISGILLIPGFLLHLVNPFAVKSPLLFFDAQQRVFEALRLESILHATASIILIAYVAKKYLKMHPLFSAVFFTISPIFLMLTFFYRYDIPVIFWVILSILFALRFAQSPTRKNYLLLGIISALTLAIKISSAPLFFTFICAFFLFVPNWRKKLNYLLLGVPLFIASFVITAIPDALISFNKFSSWIYLVVFQQAHEKSNLLLGMNYRVFNLSYAYPELFGHAFYAIFVICFFALLVFSIRVVLERKIDLSAKKELFLLISFLLFGYSVFALGPGAVGSRMLIILPFFALISGIYIEKLFNFFKNKNILLTSLLCMLIGIQLIESLSWVATRWYPDPRESSSVWVESHIPKGSVVGIENVPIFQHVPDVILKDFYTKIYFPDYKSTYAYITIDNETRDLPDIVIVSNDIQTEKYITQSDKKTLLEKLKQENYQKIATFSHYPTFYQLFNTENTYMLNNLFISAQTISIYQKQGYK